MVLNEAVTKETFLKIQSPAILHLSLHGCFVNEQVLSEVNSTVRSQYTDRWSRAWLLMEGFQYADSQLPKSIITAKEIFAMNLDGTQLVVLSACNTTLGDSSSATGTASMNQAFIIAGAQAIITTLWEINDFVTCLFMEEFYKQLITGSDCLTALDATKVIIRQKKMRDQNDNNVSLEHPYFWSAFQLYGNAVRPIIEKPSP